MHVRPIMFALAYRRQFPHCSFFAWPVNPAPRTSRCWRWTGGTLGLWESATSHSGVEALPHYMVGAASFKPSKAVRNDTNDVGLPPTNASAATCTSPLLVACVGKIERGVNGKRRVPRGHGRLNGGLKLTLISRITESLKRTVFSRSYQRPILGSIWWPLSHLRRVVLRNVSA